MIVPPVYVLLPTVTAINREIRELAPVLNSRTLPELVKVTALPSREAHAVDATAGEPAIASMTKRLNGTTYLFTVNMGNRAVSASFQLTETAKARSRGGADRPSRPGAWGLEVIGRGRAEAVGLPCRG